MAQSVCRTMNTNITFDLKKFKNKKSCALNFLKQLKHLGDFKRNSEIDEFFCQQPSYAYKYVLHILSNKRYNFEKKAVEYLETDKSRLSPDNEKVFKKNIKFAIAYLKITNQKTFRDPKLQKYFEKKIYQDAGFAYDYANLILKGRIPEEKESIFLSNYPALFYYSKNILKGKFPESIHKKIILETFNDENKTRWRYDLLTAYIAQDFSKGGTRDYSYCRY